MAPPSRSNLWKIRRTTWLVLGVFFVLALLLIFPYYPGWLAARRAAEEATVGGTLRHIGNCAAEYEAKHQSYPSTLAAMGTAAESCRDLASVAGKPGLYEFSYTPGPADVGGRIATYRAEARPVGYGGRRTTSYFIDGSGVIRFTDQPRSANANDPSLREVRGR